MILRKKPDKEIVNILKSGGIGVLKTDTLYGLVGSALNRKTIERIYKIRKRNPAKPFIILISKIKDLEIFGINPDSNTKKILKRYWPGKVSIILPCASKKFSYLHRGTKSLAFRLPAKKSLTGLIQKTGPLVAPSANPEGLRPALGINQAKKYFGNQVDFYLDTGKSGSRVSKLIEIKKGVVRVLRE